MMGLWVFQNLYNDQLLLSLKKKKFSETRFQIWVSARWWQNPDSTKGSSYDIETESLKPEHIQAIYHIINIYTEIK